MGGFVLYLLFLADSFWLGVMASGLALSLIFLSFVIVTGLGGSFLAMGAGVLQPAVGLALAATAGLGSVGVYYQGRTWRPHRSWAVWD